MKPLFFILLTTTMLACSEEKMGEIPLFNGLAFRLLDNEKNGAIDTDIKNKYAEYFNSEHTQIPLFKYIKNNDYQIFIGLPYNSSVAEIIAKKSGKQGVTMIDAKSDSLYYFVRYNKEGVYVTEFASNFKNNSLIFISTMTTSKEISDALFNELELSRRIKTN